MSKMRYWLYLGIAILVSLLVYVGVQELLLWLTANIN